MKMKKYIALFIAITVILSSFTFTAFAAGESTGTGSTDVTATADQVTAEATAAPSTNVDTTKAEETTSSMPGNDVPFADDYKFLSALGIFDSVDDGFKWDNETVTRAQFATIVARMTKAQTEGYQTYAKSPYIDVDSNNFAYNSICYLNDIGIVSGDGTSAFRPNDPITLAEATKMVMVALGYKVAAEKEGGYPTGYANYAMKADVYENIKNVSLNSNISVMSMVVLVKNALEAELLEATTFTKGDGIDYTLNGNTLLSTTFKLVESEGIVNGSYYGYLEGGEITEKDYIVIGERYQVVDTINPNEYLGQYVTYYYKEDVDGYKLPVIYYIGAKSGKNYITTVNAHDIYSFDGDVLKYADPKTGKEKEITIPDDASVCYNGKPYHVPTDNTFRIAEGNMTIIGNSSSTKADAVIINEYFDGVFDKVAEKTMQVLFDNDSNNTLPTLILEEDSKNDCRTKIYLDGEEIDYTQLQKGDVLTYTISKGDDKNSTYSIVYVSRDVVSAKIAAKGTKSTASGDITVVTVDGVKYDISSYTTDSLNVGSTYDIQLTFDGRVVGTNGITSSNGLRYGYLIDCGEVTGSFDNDASLEFKILSTDGTIKIYPSATKVRSNVGNVEKSYDDDQLAKSGTEFEKQTVIEYDTNASGQIKTIYLPVNTQTDEDGFALYYSDSSVRLVGNLAEKCAISDDTIIFKVTPTINNRKDEYYKVAKRAEISDGDYEISLYDVRDGVANVMEIKESNPKSLKSDANILVVDEVIAGYDEATDDTVDMISGVSNGEKVEVTIDDNCVIADGVNDQSGKVYKKTISELKRGDVIQYITDVNDKMTVYRVLFDINVIKDTDLSGNPLYYEEFRDDKFGSPEEPKYKMAEKDYHALYAEVTYVNDYYFIVNSRLYSSDVEDILKPKWDKAYPFDSAKIYEYDVDKDEVNVIEPYEIEEGDRVFMVTKNNYDKITVLVIKD